MSLRIDNRLSQAYVLKGSTEIAFERNFNEAEKSLNRALELNPNNAEAYNWKSQISLMHGRFGEAATIVSKAIQFDPTSIYLNEHLVRISFYSGEYNRAIIQAEELLEFEKNNLVPLAFSALSYAHLRLFKQSLENIEKALKCRRGPEIVFMKAYILALNNDRIQAEDIISNVLKSFPENQIDPTDLAYVYSASGDIEKAFEMLERAYEINSTNLCILKVEKRCENLRRDPRFEAFLTKIGLS